MAIVNELNLACSLLQKIIRSDNCDPEKHNPVSSANEIGKAEVGSICKYQVGNLYTREREPVKLKILEALQ